MEAKEITADIKSENAIDSSRNKNTLARHRRLRIQQNILQKGVKHLYSKLQEYKYDCSLGNDILYRDEDHTYIEQIKKMFTNVKNLYEEIRFLTNETNKGKSSDIDEIKRNILLLESKIKELKIYLKSELETLGKEEVALNHQQTIRKKLKSETSTAPKLIAPSPVKVLIQSPFKCSEVQQYQEFMKRTKRYGGWNEYDHSKFIQIWNNYYSNNLDFSQRIDINSEKYDHLIQELLTRIEGTEREDIISHIEWYKQYLILYTCQKNALQKWKENRNKIKKYKKVNSQDDGRINATEHNVNIDSPRSTSVCSDDTWFSNVPARSERSNCGSGDIEDKVKIQTIAPHKSRLMEPTKQWLYRCSNENNSRAVCNIETVKKLSIPAWRIGLQN